jgi:hypothetical protein
MRRVKITALLSLLFVISTSACARNQAANNTQSAAAEQQSFMSDIPVNSSVNASWGGGMCEAGGYVFYLYNQDSKEQIIRMNADGSEPAVVFEDEDYDLYGLTADSERIYFQAKPRSAGPDIVYSLPLGGGSAQKVTEGSIMNLQCVGGRLYWQEHNPQTGTRGIKCCEPDGSDLRTLLSLTAADLNDGHFECLVTEEGIYYVIDPDIRHSDIYRVDLTGENTVKLNNDSLGIIDLFLYDQGSLYFLIENDFDVDPFSNSVRTIDKSGEITIIKDHIGYFHQGYGCTLFCGVSDGILYYFDDIKSPGGSSRHLLTDLHRYDISEGGDTILLHDVDMGAESVGTVFSIRGRCFEGALSGMYILGNDVYFAPARMI